MKRLVLCGFTAIASSMLCADDLPSDQIQPESKAVVLDQVLFDSWYGFGACYQMWQEIKNWTGFSLSDQVNISDESTSKEALLSEVTEGTVCILDDLIVQYKAASTSPEYSEEEQLEAAFYVEDLQRDHANLLDAQPLLISDSESASTSAEYSEEEQLEAAFYVEDLQRDHDNLLDAQPSLISDSEIELFPVSSEESVFIDEINLDAIPAE